MSKLPQVSGTETVKALEKIGFVVVQQRGSHIKLERRIADQVQMVIVPNHKEIKKGTLRNGIFKPINLAVKDFIKIL